MRTKNAFLKATIGSSSAFFTSVMMRKSGRLLTSFACSRSFLRDVLSLLSLLSRFSCFFLSFSCLFFVLSSFSVTDRPGLEPIAAMLSFSNLAFSPFLVFGVECAFAFCFLVSHARREKAKS